MYFSFATLQTPGRITSFEKAYLGFPKPTGGNGLCLFRLLYIEEIVFLTLAKQKQYRKHSTEIQVVRLVAIEMPGKNA